MSTLGSPLEAALTARALYRVAVRQVWLLPCWTRVRAELEPAERVLGAHFLPACCPRATLGWPWVEVGVEMRQGNVRSILLSLVSTQPVALAVAVRRVAEVQAAGAPCGGHQPV